MQRESRDSFESQLLLRNKMNPKKRNLRVIMFLVLLLLIYRAMKDKKDLTSYEITGQTMGTISYIVKFRSMEESVTKYNIDSLLIAFNQSLSTYIPTSEISIFNKEDTLYYESDMFYPVLESSTQVYNNTEGAYDPTIAPLVNIWGFGPNGRPETPDSAAVDSMLQLVDFTRIKYDRNAAVKPSEITIDFSAIAKGYAVDLVGEYLEKYKVENYMVEIGGEVRTKGLNDKEEIWSIGIDDPLVEINERKLMAIVSLADKSMATSGNYRNYYEVDGKTVAHIIDPRTGYNNFQSILSATVFSASCMEADAYATAFMVMGMDKSKELLQKVEGLDAILIYQEGDETRSYTTDGIKEYVQMNRAKEAAAL